MKILFVLTYYHPHVSGLTIYVKRLAEALARRGHQVTVLTSRHDPTSPREEWLEGVRVIRAPVAAQISKGVIMPSFPFLAAQLARRNDIVSIHLPQFEAGLVTIIARLLRRPVVLTYHCDLQLPAGRVNRIIDELVFAMNYVAALFANLIVAYTQDYADHSRLLSRFKRKLRIILPPVVVPMIDPVQRQSIRERAGLNGDCVVGMCTRVAAEKGVEYLLEAIPLIEAEIPNVKLVHAGEYQHVLGEEAYLAQLQPLIDRLGDRVSFLGVIPSSQIGAFFSNLDVLVVASVNSTESFGLVQVESMLCGAPVVATNLPGVREPIRITGMGEIVPLRDPGAIAAAVTKILKNPGAYQKPRQEIADTFDLDRTLDAYERVFAEAGAPNHPPNTGHL